METGGGTPEPIRSSRRQLANARQGASPYAKRPPAAAGGVASAIWEVKDEVSAVRVALKVSRDHRTEAQLAVIRKWLEGAKFNHLNMDDVRSVIPQLAQAMEFVEHPAFSPLFEQGDAGDYLYVVLHGEIAMHIKAGPASKRLQSAVNTTMAMDRLRKSSNDRLRKSSREGLGGGASMFRAAAQAAVAVAEAEQNGASKPGSRQASRPQTSEQSGEAREASRKPAADSAAALAEHWGKQVAVCRKGDSFGELALMSTQPRAATAVSAAGVELARLHTSVYQKLLKERAEASLREKVATLCAQPSFASMDHRELQKLSYSFHTTTRPARACIVGQGMQGEHLHILKSGEVRVLWREGAGCPNYEVATLLQGELIGVLGESADESVSEFTLQTVRPCELYSVTRTEFLARFKPEVQASTRELIRAKSETWRQRAQAKRLTEPKLLTGLLSTPNSPRGGGGMERRASARKLANTKRYSVEGTADHKRFLESAKGQPSQTMARPAVPAFAGGLDNLSISSPGAPSPFSAESPRSRAKRLVSLPQAMPSSWQRGALALNPLGFQ